jgi:phenylalanyl-tRNA synthetase beta chain
MLINMEWLEEWVEVGSDAEDVGAELTTAGLEVEGVTPVAPGLDGVVVAEIVAVQPHPNADRLRLCRVADGAAVHEVVCGAPNAAAGLKVAFAPPGATLPGGRTIEAAEVRGIVSSGMLCSAKELGLSEEGAGLLVLDDAALPGASLVSYLRLSDAVLDVNITPNRGDCFSAIGLARELAAKHGRPLRGPALTAVEAQSGDAMEVVLEAPQACARFAGRIVRGLAGSARSPDWLRERLQRAGLRAIHPIVDVTNYVMLELGQPLHAYRLDRLTGRVVARMAHEGEPLELLDGRHIALDSDVFVIADENGPLGMAGIMGGAASAVTGDTTEVFLEAAYFAPDAIAGRARRYGLHTDASTRFERGVDPAGQERAIERATALLCAIAGGRPGPTILVEDRDSVPNRSPITLRAAKIEAVLGLRPTDATVEKILERLGMTVAAEEGGWRVTPPTFRFDLAIEEDLIEELARLIGYDNVPIRPGAGPAHLGTATEQRVGEGVVADTLVARGYDEVITYSFVDEESATLFAPGREFARLANPLSSDLNVMRRSLWPGLMQTAKQNLSRQQSRARLFEIGTRFAPGPDGVEEATVLAGLATGPQWPEHWDNSARDADFFDIKADVECLLELTGRRREFEFRTGEHPALHPSQAAKICLGEEIVGWLGVVHPLLQKRYELRSSAVLFSLRLEPTFAARVPSFVGFSKYPSVRRDLAVTLPEDVPVQRLVENVEAEAGARLRAVKIFDLYRGKGIDSRRKSVGLGLILQDVSRTLTDDDADRIVGLVMRRLEHELGAKIRN